MDTEALQHLTKDLRKAAETMTSDEARFLVDAYYQMQENRIRSDGQIRSQEGEPHAVLGWLSDNNLSLENQIKLALSAYAKSQPMGRWAMEVKGIGPVLSAGLLAHIDIEKAPTVGHIWRYAGLDPTCKWEKKTKRPWNAALKVICWKMGESFVKVSGHDDAFYGKIYLERKEYETAKNEKGEYAEQAKAGMERVGKTTEAYKHYKEGKLPPGHIHARAKRYAVKLFLSHWHAEAYRQKFGKEPPLPYPIGILGHAHKIEAIANE